MKESPFCRSDIYTMFNKREQLPDIFYKFFKEEKKIWEKLVVLECCDYSAKKINHYHFLNYTRKRFLSVTFDYEDGNPLNESGALSEVYLKQKYTIKT